MITRPLHALTPTVLLFALGCGTATAEGTASRAPTSTPNEIAGRVSTAAPPTSAPAAARPSERVMADVSLVCGGMFSPDHLGPDEHRRVVARVQAEPTLYLDALEDHFASCDDACLASRHPDALLALVAPTCLARTRLATAEMAERYELALSRAPSHAEHHEALRARAATLRALLGSLPLDFIPATMLLQPPSPPTTVTATDGVEDPFHHVLHLGGEHWVVLRVDVEDVETSGPTRVITEDEDGADRVTSVLGAASPGESWVLHGGGTSCPAQLSRPHVLERVTHLSSDGAPPTVHGRRAFLVARVESGPCASGAGWASSRPVEAYQRAEPSDPSLDARVLAEVHRHPEWQAARERHAQGGGTTATWEQTVTLHEWRSAQGNRWVIYEGHAEGERCTDFGADLTVILRLDAQGAPQMLAPSAPPLTVGVLDVADLDADGRPELLLSDGWAAVTADGGLEATLTLYVPTPVCPC